MVFNDQSRCDVGGTSAPCDLSSFKQGEEKSVTGKLDNGTIIVSNMGPRKAIENYYDCIFYGYPILESYPEQCMADGKTFTNPEN